jgi:hypothetical protein
MKPPATKFAAVVIVMMMANVGIIHLRSKAIAYRNFLPIWINRILGWTPLEIESPRPMFVSTPFNIRVNHLRKHSFSKQPPFWIPVGTTNVGLDKPVEASDKAPIIGKIEMINDGDKKAADGSYVELNPSLQYVTIDLGEIHEIFAVVVWHYHKQLRVYFDVIVQTADDPDFITNVTTLFNNDIDNSAGLGAGTDMHYIEVNEGELIDAKRVKARYIRLYSNGNSANAFNHYIEVEVYGKPAR